MKVLTWVPETLSDQVDSNTKLHGENNIQYACNPFLLPCNGVGSDIVKMSELNSADEGKSDLWARTIWAAAVTHVG